MAKPSHLQFFLDTFIKVNVEKYKDDPEFVAKLKALTLENTSITDIVAQGDGGKHDSKVASLFANFTGEGQAWTRGDLEEVIDQSKAQVVADKAAFDKADKIGLYLIGDKDDDHSYGVVYDKDLDEAGIKAYVTKTILDACIYQLAEDCVTVSTDKCVVSCETFGGDVVTKVAAAAEPETIVIPPTDYGQLKTVQDEAPQGAPVVEEQPAPEAAPKVQQAAAKKK